MMRKYGGILWSLFWGLTLLFAMAKARAPEWLGLLVVTTTVFVIRHQYRRLAADEEPRGTRWGVLLVLVLAATALIAALLLYVRPL